MLHFFKESTTAGRLVKSHIFQLLKTQRIPSVEQELHNTLPPKSKAHFFLRLDGAAPDLGAGVGAAKANKNSW